MSYLKKKTGTVTLIRKTKAIKKQKWFNKNCFDLKKEVRNLGYLVSKYPNDPIVKNNFFKTKKTYKKLVKRTTFQFKNDLLDKICSLESNNPKDFWKLVKNRKSMDLTANTSNADIPPIEWHKYFSDLNKDKCMSNNLKAMKLKLLKTSIPGHQVMLIFFMILFPFKKS